MQKPQGVAHFLVPADPHAPRTVHPALRALHHPPSGLATGLLLQRLDFLAPGLAMCRATPCVEPLPHLGIIVSLCPDTSPGGRLGGVRLLHGHALDGSWVSVQSCRCAPSTARPIGTPRPSVRTRRLVPIVPRLVWSYLHTRVWDISSLMPASSPKHDASIRCRERLGGLLQY
jgi:hypothetical protein